MVWIRSFKYVWMLSMDNRHVPIRSRSTLKAYDWLVYQYMGRSENSRGTLGDAHATALREKRPRNRRNGTAWREATRQTLQLADAHGGRARRVGGVD